MRHFKKLLVTAALVVSGTCSAATFDEANGTNIAISSAGEYEFNGNWDQGDDSDTWTFDIAPGLSLNRLGVGTPSIGDLVVTFHATLDGVSSPASYQMFGASGLSAGSHTLKLSPEVKFGNGKHPYFGALVVAAVPEPETYAMFLAGLGIMGAMARRRKSA